MKARAAEPGALLGKGSKGCAMRIAALLGVDEWIRTSSIPARFAELLQQWPKIRRIGAPASDRAAVDRPAHLRRARGADRTSGLVKREAGRVPVPTPLRDDAPRPSIQVGHYVLVADVEDPPGREHAVPMRHQPPVASIIAAKL